MIENIRLSFQGIWSHKMRSFLTMLGIIIGIASIIAIVSTIQGTNEQIKRNLIGSGNNLVQVQLYQSDMEYDLSYNPVPSGIPEITDAMLEALRAMPEIEAATSYLERSLYSDSIFYKNQSLGSCHLYGVESSYLETTGYEVILGRGFTEDDYRLFRRVMLIDDASANALFGQGEALGQILEINSTPFTIIGVIRELDSFEPVIQSVEDYYTYMTNSTGIICIPSCVWPILYQFDEPQNLAVRAASTDDMTQAGKLAADLLNQSVSNSDGIQYQAEDRLEQAKSLQEMSNSTNQQLIWIASISLLVGGIGVMNIMLVSVTERTREIGLKKALGARKRRILSQFLTEAAVLTSLGGLLGVGCGIGLAELISNLTGTPSAINIAASIAAVAFSMVIGILFGLLPSVKAANLNPIDALRYE